jgi:hypothetical protein
MFDVGFSLLLFPSPPYHPLPAPVTTETTENAKDMPPIVLQELRQFLSMGQSLFMDDRAGHRLCCSHQGALGDSPMFNSSHHGGHAE